MSIRKVKKILELLTVSDKANILERAWRLYFSPCVFL